MNRLITVIGLTILWAMLAISATELAVLVKAGAKIGIKDGRFEISFPVNW